jgi:hypothetical protein
MLMDLVCDISVSSVSMRQDGPSDSDLAKDIVQLRFKCADSTHSEDTNLFIGCPNVEPGSH